MKKRCVKTNNQQFRESENTNALNSIFAIRAILDCEIETNKENTVLPQVVSILLDKSEELTDEENKKLNYAIKTVTISDTGGVTGTTLATIFSGIVGVSLGSEALADTAISLDPIYSRRISCGNFTLIKKILGKN